MTSDGDGPVASDDELGPPVTALSDLSLEASAQFGDRVRRRIERRVLVGQVLDLAWTAPLTMLIEFLRVSFELLAGRRRP